MKIVITVIAILLCVLCASYYANADYRIITKSDNTIEQYKDASVVVFNNDYNTLTEQRQGDEVTFVYLEIVSALREMGISPNGDEKTARLKVECHFRQGFGFPRLIRHFKIKFKYITTLSIKIIDATNNKMLGEIEYNRPWMETNPINFIKTMLNKILIM